LSNIFTHNCSAPSIGAWSLDPEDESTTAAATTTSTNKNNNKNNHNYFFAARGVTLMLLEIEKVHE